MVYVEVDEIVNRHTASWCNRFKPGTRASDAEVMPDRFCGCGWNSGLTAPGADRGAPANGMDAQTGGAKRSRTLAYFGSG